MSGHGGGEPTEYRVGIARVREGFEAWVFDLPGCLVMAAERDALLDLLPVAIAEHLSWLDSHGDVTRDAFPFRLEVVEEVDVRRLPGVADGEFAFADDLRPATREEVEAAMRRMAYARRDLLDVVRPLPDLVLDWRPPAGTVYEDAWAPGARTIREIIGHVASADGHYAASISAKPSSLSERERSDVFAQRQRAIERLRSLSEEDLGREFRRRQAWQEEGEERWTVRKALRRFIAHERFHTREVQQRLAWVLLGLPGRAT